MCPILAAFANASMAGYEQAYLHSPTEFTKAHPRRNQQLQTLPICFSINKAYERGMLCPSPLPQLKAAPSVPYYDATVVGTGSNEIIMNIECGRQVSKLQVLVVGEPDVWSCYIAKFWRETQIICA